MYGHVEPWGTGSITICIHSVHTFRCAAPHVFLSQPRFSINAQYYTKSHYLDIRTQYIKQADLRIQSLRYTPDEHPLDLQTIIKMPMIYSS